MKASTSSSVLAAMMFGWLPTVVPGADFQPDPVAVQRFGPGYRYPQAGWIVIHIQGDAYERGVQHGRLLALEIAAYVKCLALLTNPKAPEDSWKVTRSMCNALFLRGFTAEQLQEMKGIADGAAAAGARHEGHPVDLLDILAINTFTEYESLDKALDVTPSSLAGRPDAAAKAAQKSSLKMQEQPKPSHCISFAATAPVTKDGKVVFGHITMFDAYPARFFNVWLDLQPNAGHRFVMQTYPGGIHSGMDYVISDAGLMLGETNISQTSFDIKGVPLASRIRQAIQYAGSISDAAEILGSHGNGLAATEWVLADAGKNETALFTLGTRAKQLHLSSMNDWLAGTDGFYWSCNNSKDLEHRLETLESLHGRPSPIGIFNPTTRDAIWLRLFERGKGTIGEDFARDVLTNPSLVSAASVDAKYTTSDLARELKSWATFGPPVGSTTVPDPRAFKDRPDARTMVSHPWTLLHAVNPPIGKQTGVPRPVDLHNPSGNELAMPTPSVLEYGQEPAWHGTLIPASDADIWLTGAFAIYESIVGLDHAVRKRAGVSPPSGDDLDQIGRALFAQRAGYEIAARSGQDVPLAQTLPDPHRPNAHEVAYCKGVLLLHALRGLAGAEKFDGLMDEFGLAHAGQQVSTAQFREHMEKGLGRSLGVFFNAWLTQPGLPKIAIAAATVRHEGKRWITSVTMTTNALGAGLTVPVSVETKDGEAVTQTIVLDGEKTHADIATEKPAVRLVVDGHGLAGLGNSGPFSIHAFMDDPEHTIIVYGTLDEESANRETALLLQHDLRQGNHTIVMPVRKDTEVTDDDMKECHVVVIGRPATNTVSAHFHDAWPVRFGLQSFEISRKVYAHAETSFIGAAENPLNPRYSMVLLAGLNSQGTFNGASGLLDDAGDGAQAAVMMRGSGELTLITVTPVELVRDLTVLK